ncbi:MAG: methionine synthase [Methanomicrobiales archaeon]|nr:methionine synthase [Methanomicrobiales archaeon]
MTPSDIDVKRKTHLTTLFSQLPLLPTTVVGSYPVVPAQTRYERARYIMDPQKASVSIAVQDQKSAGISIISDGQVRGDMIETFSSKLPGIREKNVVGSVKPATHYITTADTKYAISKHPFVKGIITGPSTLTYGLHLQTSSYRNKKELTADITASLLHEAKGLLQAGVCILQLDEPIFSTGVCDLSIGRETIQRFRDEISLPLCLHVCGPIHTIIDEYVSMPVDILDFEGTQEAENLSVLSQKELMGKYIGYGCIDTTKPVLESVHEIILRIEQALEYIPPQKILLDPDCGMRMLPHEVAYEKIIRLCTAAKSVRESISRE